MLISTLKMKHEDYIIKIFTPNLVLVHSCVIGALQGDELSLKDDCQYILLFTLDQLLTRTDSTSPPILPLVLEICGRTLSLTGLHLLLCTPYAPIPLLNNDCMKPECWKMKGYLRAEIIFLFVHCTTQLQIKSLDRRNPITLPSLQFILN